jgi:hypothetical protein
MGRAAWYPTMWNAQDTRAPSKLLARRAARRGRPEFKAKFPRSFVIGPLVITHERPWFVPEELFVYTPHSALRGRRGLASMWIDVHALANWFQWCNPFWVEALPRAVHCGPVESDPGQYLGCRDP